MYSDFYKVNPTDQIWWIDHIGVIGEYLFSFDKKRIFNFFEDYPQNLTKEQIEIFDRENSSLAELKNQFSDEDKIERSMFIKVKFPGSKNLYDYLCDISEIKAGDCVIVSTKNGEQQVVVSEMFFEYLTNMPLPEDRYKKVIRRIEQDKKLNVTMTGKDKCEFLRNIRVKIAMENNIPYFPNQCTHKGDCSGTCPLCEAELMYLTDEIEKRKAVGQYIKIDTVNLPVLEHSDIDVTPDNLEYTLNTYSVSNVRLDGGIPDFKPPTRSFRQADLLYYELRSMLGTRYNEEKIAIDSQIKELQEKIVILKIKKKNLEAQYNMEKDIIGAQRCEVEKLFSKFEESSHIPPWIKK